MIGEHIPPVARFLRRDGEGQHPEPQRVALGSLAESVCAELGALILDRELDFDLNVSGECTVMGQAEWLHVLLRNLLDNAIRHTASGGRIRLQARRHGERVIVSVEDSGEGIAYGQQGRIFEPFVQVGRKKGGAGLGLALCKEIVQLHGGRMGVYSRPDQGTQFYMALPV
jgi:NtrC-family two-component system sensor histidine kinase KinB